MYLLVNRDSIIIDTLSFIRYIKTQPISGLVIGCEESEATGVIASDCNTHYPLVKSDIYNSSNAVEVIQIAEDQDIKPYKYKWINGEIVPRYVLAELRDMKQQENKEQFKKYLEENPLIWIDGKEYGITEEDQIEINLNLSQYQNNNLVDADLPLQWHAKGEENVEWSAQELRQLNAAIQQAVRPAFRKMQEYKTQIFRSDDMDAINLVYSKEVFDE